MCSGSFRRRRLNDKQFGHRAVLLVVLTLLITNGILVVAQEKAVTKTVTKPGVLSGRVFAITNGGDVKPARMANIYLLYEYHGKTVSDKEYQGTAGGMAWSDQESRRLKDYSQWLKENGKDTSESLWCRTELLGYNKSVLEIMKWADSENKRWQVIIGQADEEGTFKISVPHPGKYRLLIRGRAGFNEAYWNTDVAVNAGVETTVKLAAPSKSCLEIE